MLFLPHMSVGRDLFLSYLGILHPYNIRNVKWWKVLCMDDSSWSVSTNSGLDMRHSNLSQFCARPLRTHQSSQLVVNHESGAIQQD